MVDIHWQKRTELLIKSENLRKLHNSNVFVAGLGGVGAYTAEMLCRAGVGQLTIADGDQIKPSNRNRQLLALESTLGERKAGIMSKRLLDINPGLRLTVYDEFLHNERTEKVLEQGFDYVVDAIDTLSPKIFLIQRALMLGIPLVSSMGAGGKMDPSKIQVADFSNTYHCKLARILRKRLRPLRISGGFKAVFSTEPVNGDAVLPVENEPNKKTTLGTISYMPAMFGCLCASVVIRELLGLNIEMASRPKELILKASKNQNS